MPLLEQPKTKEIYQSIKRSLRLKDGFGLFFIICTPAQAQEITKQIKDDFGKFKNIETLTLTEEVPELHSRINAIKEAKLVDILLISGIEKSLDAYVKSESNDKFGGRGGYYQLDETSLPPLLTHLNLQRESYKQDFPFALVFFLSPFAYRFLVRRAPDFFDWRSGIFEVPRDLPEEQKEILLQIYKEINKILGQLHNIVLSSPKTQFKPDDYQTWNNLGITLANLGRYREAIDCFDKALQFKPNEYPIWNNRGIALANLGKYEDAILDYDKALQIKPSYHQALYKRGNALDKLGRYEEAIYDYNKALQIQPNYYEAWYDRGVALHNLGRYEEAINSYDKALQIQPDLHQALTNQGVALSQLDRCQEAINSYDKALQFQPNDNQAWNNRGVALDKLGRCEEAINSYDKALQIEPNNHLAWNNRAGALGKLKRYEESITSFDKALEIQPNLHETGYGLASTYALQENITEAISHLRQAIKLNPEYLEMAKTDSDFDGIRDNEDFVKVINSKTWA